MLVVIDIKSNDKKKKETTFVLLVMEHLIDDSLKQNICSQTNQVTETLPNINEMPSGNKKSRNDETEAIITRTARCYEISLKDKKYVIIWPVSLSLCLILIVAI